MLTIPEYRKHQIADNGLLDRSKRKVSGKDLSMAIGKHLYESNEAKHSPLTLWKNVKVNLYCSFGSYTNGELGQKGEEAHFQLLEAVIESEILPRFYLRLNKHSSTT